MITHKVFTLVLSLIVLTEATEKDVKTTYARTELRVAKSLNPEDTQTLNVMTRDGNVAQLIVKKRDPKTKLTTPTKEENNDLTSSFYSNWFPVKSVYLPPNLIRLNTFALVKNDSKPINNNLGNIVNSDRIPHVPNPITVRSENLYVKQPHERLKRGRSLMEIGSDGIPVVHGVRVPDDESDEKVWRNARVINGELVPYEKGYKPPAAVPIGELVYANNGQQDPNFLKGIGPFTTSDNFDKAQPLKTSYGPFTVQDNHSSNKPEKETQYVTFSSSKGMGPFTVADNTNPLKSTLYDYIKEINDQESRRDYYSKKRRYRSYETENEPQIQRRMLQNVGTSSYPNSALYTPPSTKLSPVNFNEGVRAPILQYAHPELGVQPAKATPEKEAVTHKDNDLSKSPYDLDPNANDDLEHDASYPRSPYYTNSIQYYKKDVINYPFNNYYINRKTSQPFWIRLTESIKDNVHNGFQRMHQLTRPVFDPILEATHKITHNLGFAHSPQRAQDKVDLITPMGGGSIILPALGLVAGGAALGLGAAAVGRFLQPEELRALQGLAYPNDLVLIMEEPSNVNEHKRMRRDIERLDEQHLQKIYSDVNSNHLQHLSGSHFWSDTPCAKKIFCEAMVRQHPDEVVLMEKKMGALLSMINLRVMENVGEHFQDVMNAIKTRSCFKFDCSRKLAIPFV